MSFLLSSQPSSLPDHPFFWLLLPTSGSKVKRLLLHICAFVCRGKHNIFRVTHEITITMTSRSKQILHLLLVHRLGVSGFTPVFTRSAAGHSLAASWQRHQDRGFGRGGWECELRRTCRGRCPRQELGGCLFIVQFTILCFRSHCFSLLFLGFPFFLLLPQVRSWVSHFPPVWITFF